MHKEAREEVKQSVGEAKLKAYGELHNNLSSKDVENAIYKLVKLCDKKIKDFGNVCCIIGEDETCW